MPRSRTIQIDFGNYAKIDHSIIKAPTKFERIEKVEKALPERNKS